MESETTWISSCRSSRPRACKPILAAIWLLERVRVVGSGTQCARREAEFYIAPRRCQFDAASAVRKKLGTDLVFKNPFTAMSKDRQIKLANRSIQLLCHLSGFTTKSNLVRWLSTGQWRKKNKSSRN